LTFLLDLFETSGLQQLLASFAPNRLDDFERNRNEVIFNYFGQIDASVQREPLESLLQPISANALPNIHPEEERRYLFEWTGRIYNDRLSFHIGYSENRHERESVEKLGEFFLEGLRAIVIAAAEPEEDTTSPEDFPLADLDQEALDMIMGNM